MQAPAPAGPPSAYRGGFAALPIILWVLLAISAVEEVAAFRSWLAFSYEVTCVPPPPTEYRQHEMIFWAIVHVVLWLPALVLAITGKRIPVIVGVVLASLSVGVPILSMLAQLFEVGMC